jgi:hypothetical protein
LAIVVEQRVRVPERRVASIGRVHEHVREAAIDGADVVESSLLLRRELEPLEDMRRELSLPARRA